MASRQYRSNRIYNWHVFPVHLDAQVSIGSSGAPTLISSSTVPGSSPSASQSQSVGIKSITRLAQGIYQARLDDNYTSLLDFKVMFNAPVSGSPLAVDASDAALSVGTVYQIVTVGTSTAANFHTLGVPAGITPAVGVIFKAAATGAGTGNGTVKVLGAQAASAGILLGGGPDLMLNSQPFNQGQGGGYITFQTLGATFTGSALGSHTHDLTIIGGQASSTTNDVAVYGGDTLGKEAATDATIAGSASATKGGVVAASAGTPAGTISMGPVDPSSGSIMYLRLLLSNSSIG